MQYEAEKSFSNQVVIDLRGTEQIGGLSKKGKVSEPGGDFFCKGVGKTARPEKILENRPGEEGTDFGTLAPITTYSNFCIFKTLIEPNIPTANYPVKVEIIYPQRLYQQQFANETGRQMFTAKTYSDTRNEPKEKLVCTLEEFESVYPLSVTTLGVNFVKPLYIGYPEIQNFEEHTIAAQLSKYNPSETENKKQALSFADKLNIIESVAHFNLSLLKQGVAFADQTAYSKEGDSYILEFRDGVPIVRVNDFDITPINQAQKEDLLEKLPIGSRLREVVNKHKVTNNMQGADFWHNLVPNYQNIQDQRIAAVGIWLLQYAVCSDPQVSCQRAMDAIVFLKQQVKNDFGDSFENVDASDPAMFEYVANILVRFAQKEGYDAKPLPGTQESIITSLVETEQKGLEEGKKIAQKIVEVAERNKASRKTEISIEEVQNQVAQFVLAYLSHKEIAMQLIKGGETKVPEFVSNALNKHFTVMGIQLEQEEIQGILQDCREIVQILNG